jgi:hypothetical protein
MQEGRAWIPLVPSSSHPDVVFVGAPDRGERDQRPAPAIRRTVLRERADSPFWFFGVRPPHRPFPRSLAPNRPNLRSCRPRTAPGLTAFGERSVSACVRRRFGAPPTLSTAFGGSLAGVPTATARSSERRGAGVRTVLLLEQQQGLRSRPRVRSAGHYGGASARAARRSPALHSRDVAPLLDAI